MLLETGFIISLSENRYQILFKITVLEASKSGLIALLLERLLKMGFYSAFKELL